MSKAKDEYLKLCDHIDSLGGHLDDEITSYVAELEAEKAELIKFIIDIYFHKLGIGDYHVKITELYNKYEDEK